MNKWQIKLGKWAQAKSFAYYKTQTDRNGRPGSYKGLPRYLEILVTYYNNLGRGGTWPQIQAVWRALRYRWVIR